MADDEEFSFEPLHTEVRALIPDSGPIELTEIPVWSPPADVDLPSVEAMMREITGDTPRTVGRHAAHPTHAAAGPPSPRPRA